MKILYLLFAVFLLVLQSSPGFTRYPACEVRKCIQNGGLCFGTCPPPFIQSGSCGCGVSCCQWRFQCSLIRQGLNDSPKLDEKLSQ